MWVSLVYPPKNSNGAFGVYFDKTLTLKKFTKKL